MLRSPARIAALAFVGAACWLGVPVSAQVPCPAADADLASIAQGAVKGWEQVRGFRVTPAAQEEVVQLLCSAAGELVQEEGLDPQAIAEGAQAPIWSYLDQMTGRARRVTSLKDLTASSFVVGSEPGLPEPRRMGVVKIEYRRNVHQLRVGGRMLDPTPLLVAEVGSLAIAGLAGNRLVCQGIVNVRPRVRASFTC